MKNAMDSKYKIGDLVYFLVSTDVRQAKIISISHDSYNTDYSEDGSYAYKLSGSEEWITEDDVYNNFGDADNQR